jgi:hypothetical protein
VHVALILVALLITQTTAAAAVVAWRSDDAAARVASEPVTVVNPDFNHVVVRTPPPRPAVTRHPVRPAPRPHVRRAASAPRRHVIAKPKPVDRLAALRGLGTWVDLYDYGTSANKPVTTLVAQAAAQHITTIWVETSRYNTADIAYPPALGSLVDAAAARDIRVIAWVLPEFRSVNADLRKARAAAAFRSPRGRRFAALGLDIEVSSGAQPAERSARLIALSKAVHGHVGMPVVAIVPPPVGFSRNPGYWPGFPWRTVAGNADALATMGYWSFSKSEAGGYTATDLAQTRALVGRASYPIHVIGGLAADTTPAGAAAFCRAARSGHALGASLYDLTSTPASLVSPLQTCRKVGH